MKKCCRCKLILEDECFHLNAKMCKKCKSIYNKIRYDHKREHILKCGKLWKQKNILVNRKYFNGKLDPDSNVGIGVITEYIVSSVLNDCKKCNSVGSFNAPCDLISKKYGTINVKSSKQYNLNGHAAWTFSKRKYEMTPDYYVCLAFNENKTEFIHIWIIPSNCIYVNAYNISVYSESKIQKLKKFEVDLFSYNNIYKNLDISNLFEFRRVHDDN